MKNILHIKKHTSHSFKILGKGELTTKLTFRVNGVSETAKKAIEATGGTIEIV